jgi:hypothetical protein
LDRLQSITGMELHRLTNDQLIESTRKAIEQERRSTLSVLSHLLEMEDRRLYLDLGFNSLFEFAVQYLGYPEDGAYRRIQAMRLLRQFPDTAEKIETGRLSLTNAAQLQRYFSEQPTHKNLLLEEKIHLLQLAENKSTRELKKELVSRDPDFISRETLRSINDLEFELKVVIGQDLKEKLERLRFLLSHKYPEMLYKDLLGELSHLGEEKWDPLVKQAKKTKQESPAQLDFAKESLQPKVKTVTKGLRRAVWLRDQGCCSYVDPLTQKRCGSRYLLQIDHIQPQALGGGHQLSNLRLLCAAHNQHRALKTFGWKPSARPAE